MKRHLLWAAAMIALLASQPALAQVSIQVFPSIGPANDGSASSLGGPPPGSPGYNTNALNALAGYAVYGPSVNSPAGTAYSTPPGGYRAPIITSPFGSYAGVNSLNGSITAVNPTDNFGNSLWFGAKIFATNPNTTFSLNSTSFNLGGGSYIDPNTLSPAIPSGPVALPANYSDTYVGIISAGADGIIGTPDDILTTPGQSGATAVVGLYAVGVSAAVGGDQFSTPVTDQASLNAAIAALQGQNYTGTYSVNYTNAVNGNGTNSNSASLTVPEPASVAVMAVGVVGLFGYAWRRRRSVVAVGC